MKKKNFIIWLFSLLCVSCNGNSNNPNAVTYKVEFRNYDETILYTCDVKKNESVMYLGEKPVKEAPENSKYYYDFKGWNKSLINIQEDVTVYPLYHIIDKSELNEGDYTYRKMYQVKDDALQLIGYELYKYNNLEFSGEVIAPDNYRNLPILRVGEACFMDCDMETIVLPNTIEVIDGYAFNSSENLKQVNIPNSVYVLGNAAFYLTSSLETLNLNNIGFIDIDNFHLCNSLTSFGVSSDNHQYSVSQGVLYTKDYKKLIKAPENINNLQISNKTTSFAQEALSRMNNIKEIIIPENINKLEPLLFFESKVEKVTILANIETIDERMFQSCYNLKEIVLPPSLKMIDDYAFYKCSKLENIKLPDSVTYIGDFSFAYCFSLVEFYIPLNLRTIGYGALDEQTNLERFIVLADSYDYSVVDGCLYTKDLEKIIRVPQKKTTISFPENIKIIGSGSFYKCQGFENLILPDTLIEIEDFAFYFLNQIQILHIPDSVKVIGESAFEVMEYLVEIHLPIDLKIISRNLLANCPTLQIVNIPVGVNDIQDGAFYNCMNLPSLIIYDAVESIGKDCFSSCNNLNDIYYTGSEEMWNSINGLAYSGLTDETTIHFEYEKKD